MPVSRSKAPSSLVWGSTQTLLQTAISGRGHCKFWLLHHFHASSLTLRHQKTVAYLHTFILAMLLHPAVLKKAQAEMDQVVGNRRLPTLEDRDSLPYFDCVLKEVLRCVF